MELLLAQALAAYLPVMVCLLLTGAGTKHCGDDFGFQQAKLPISAPKFHVALK